MADAATLPPETAVPPARGSALTPRDSEVLFIESLVILALSIVATAGVIGAVLQRKYDRKGHVHYAERRRRHREIRKFLDFTVLILLGFELIQSVNWLAGTIISEKLYGNSAYGQESRQALGPKQVRGLTQACEVVGGFTYGVDIFLYLWNACLAYSMYSWIVKKALLRHLYERMKALFVVSVVVALGVSLVPAFTHSFGGRADVTCWLSTLDVTDASVILNKLVILPLCWISVGYLYTQTFSHIWRQRRTAVLTTPVTKSYERLRKRLLLFALIFFFAWLINSVWYFLLAANRASLFLGVIGKLYYAIGLLDALAYGYGSSSMGGVSFHLRARCTRLARRVQRALQRLRGVEEATPPSFNTGSTPEEAAEEGWSGLARAGGARRRCEGSEGEGEGNYYRVRSSWFTFMPDHDVMGPFPTEPVALAVREEPLALELEEGAAAAPVVEMKETIQYVSARIFATSLNCGGVARLADLGCIEEWVPKDGYDLYVIAVQECRVLGPLRRAIHYHLGGPRHFHLFEQELGDTLVSNGKIALLVFGRVADVQSGVLKLAETGGKGHVASGIDLVFSRFHNKGVVGVALQYYGTAIAFLVAHYASDSGGRKRWERRDEDAWRTLHMLHLAGDMEDFDVHLQHHHVVLLGDLNYRCQVFVGEILGKIAAAAEVEKARRGWAPYSGHAWRDDSYNRFFLPPAHRRSLSEAATTQTGISALRNPVVVAAQHKAQHKARRKEEAGAARRQQQQERGGSPSESRWETAAEDEPGGGGGGSCFSQSGGGRASSGSSTEASAHSLADLLDVMRNASCPLATQDDEAQHEAGGARHWAWACEVDELSLSRKAGVALFGFQEGPLAFPPTFKFFPGRSVEDFADITDLRYAYQVTKGVRVTGSWSPKQSRPPSWTDRILYHSLPGLESRLMLEAYDTCDAITGSDHRPVVAAFQLLLDKPVGPAVEPTLARDTTGGPVLPAPSPPPSLYLPGALPWAPTGGAVPEEEEGAAALSAGPTLPPLPRPLPLAAATSVSGVFPARRPTPPPQQAPPPILVSPPPPTQLSRMSTTASSVAGFQLSVPASPLAPTTTKTVLVSVRLSNFAFRFRLPCKPELQMAAHKKGKRKAMEARDEQKSDPSAEAAAAAASAAVASEARSAARRVVHSTAAMVEIAHNVEHEEEEGGEEEMEEVKAPSPWRGCAARGLGGGGGGGGGVAEHGGEEEDMPVGPPEGPAFASYATPTSYVTPMLAHNPPSYTRQRTVPLPSRPLRAFTGGGGAATAAERRRRTGERAAEAPPPAPTEDDIGWVVVMMPIPCEDPLFSHRRVVMMLDDPDEPSPPPAGSAAPRPGLGARLSNRLWPTGRSPPGSPNTAAGGGTTSAGAAPEVGATAAMESPLRAAAGSAEEDEDHARQHIHRFAWADVRAKKGRGGAGGGAGAGAGASGGHLRLQALLVPAGGMHAAIKFLDKKGHDLGQGVVCMKEVVLRGGASPQRVTMQLSVGGVHFGEVDMDVVIKSRAGSLGPAGGLSRAPSLAGFGATASMLAPVQVAGEWGGRRCRHR